MYSKYFFRNTVSCSIKNATANNLRTSTWSRILLRKLTGFQLIKKFPTFYGTRRFITAVTSARHVSLSWASSIQPITPHPTSWRSILILSSSHLFLGLPSGLFPSGFPTKTLYTLLLSPIRAICPVHLILLDFISRTILGEDYRSLSSSLCSFLHFPVTWSLLGPNILLNTLFSNTLSLLYSFNMSDQVSHPHKTTQLPTTGFAQQQGRLGPPNIVAANSLQWMVLQLGSWVRPWQAVTVEH